MPRFVKGSQAAKDYMAMLRAKSGRGGARRNPLDDREAAEVRALKKTNLKLADEAQAAGNFESASWRYGAAGALDVVNNRYSRDRNPSDLFALDTRSTGPGFCDKCEAEIEDARLTAQGWVCPECGAPLGEIDPENFVQPGRAEKAYGKRYGNPITRGDLRSVTRVRGQNPPMLILGNPGKSSYRTMNPRPVAAARYAALMTPGGQRFRVIHNPKTGAWGYEQEFAPGRWGAQWGARTGAEAERMMREHASYQARLGNPLNQREAERILEMSMHRGDLIRHLPEGSTGRARYDGIQSGYAEVLTEMTSDRTRRKAILAHERKHGRESQISGQSSYRTMNRGASSMRKINPATRKTDYGNGLHIKYLPVNQAWALMWNDSILRIFNSYDEARYEAEDLTRKENPLGPSEREALRVEYAKWGEHMEQHAKGPEGITGASYWHTRGIRDGIQRAVAIASPVYLPWAGAGRVKPPKSSRRVNPSSGDVAATILEQLGGNRFLAMTGAKNFVDLGGGLMFQIPTSNGINKVKIALDANDLYFVEFWNVRGMNARMVGERKFGVYADNLRHVFENATGLRTSLGTMRGENPLKPWEARAEMSAARAAINDAREVAKGKSASWLTGYAEGRATSAMAHSPKSMIVDTGRRLDRIARMGKRIANPSSSAVTMRRGNPSARMLPPRIANDPGFKREYAAYVRRHGCAPARVSVVNSPPGSPKFASAWGKAPEIKYDPASDASNKGPRVHHFGEKGGTKPYLVSSVEKGPRYLGLLGGTFRAGGEWILR